MSILINCALQFVVVVVIWWDVYDQFVLCCSTKKFISADWNLIYVVLFWSQNRLNFALSKQTQFFHKQKPIHNVQKCYNFICENIITMTIMNWDRDNVKTFVMKDGGKILWSTAKGKLFVIKGNENYSLLRRQWKTFVCSNSVLMLSFRFKKCSS